VHPSTVNPETWKLGVCLGAYPRFNRPKLNKIAENRLVLSLEPPEQLGCVLGSDYSNLVSAMTTP